MSLFKPHGSKIWWSDFHSAGKRVRENTRMGSRTRARESPPEARSAPYPLRKV